MSFAIEVPGDANPLSTQELCRALQGATSTDFAQRQAAGQQLTSWEVKPGYYSSLQTIFLDKSVPLDVRLLAIIQIKNGIDKYWRLFASVKNSLKPEEKAAMRSRLFQGTIDEDERNLALHNSLVVAKVIRIDYPQEWPNALSDVLDILRTSQHGNQRHLHGALQILLQVIKELASARLKKSQNALQAMTPEMVYLLTEIYTDKSSQWLSFLSSQQGDANESELAMRNSLLALKNLRRLVVAGYERPHEDKTVEQFWTLSQNQFGQLLQYSTDESNIPNPYHELCGKHLLQFTKLHIDTAEQRAASFAFLPNSLPLVNAYWDLVAKFAQVYDSSDGIRTSSSQASNKAKTEGPLSERLALKGLLLLRACVRTAFQPIMTFKYRTPEVKAEQERAKVIIREELLKPDLVIQIVNSIITHLFVFRRSDLEAWEEDPDEWEAQEQGESNAWEWEVRPCAEKLFLDLLTNYKDLLIPPLLQYFETTQRADADIATKEAGYTAMGLAAAHIYTVFDFDAVLASTVVTDAQQTGGLYKVLRRRIAILISQWAPVRLSDESRPLIYEIFNHFLNGNDETNDQVVQITAARQLRWIADELGFSVKGFLPFAPEVFKRLIDLTLGAAVEETKLALLETIRILVTRMEENVAQFGELLMTGLPQIWEGSGADDYMIKQAIIAIFAALVMSLGPSSQRYQQFMVPLLSEAARPGSDLHVHLVDELLELWNNLLMQSQAPISPELLNLVELALPLLDYATETASQALTALESYLLISPAAMLEDRFRRPALTALSGAMDSRSREQVKLATLCIEYMIRSAVELGGPQGVSVIITDMLETGFMKKIMEGLYDAWQASQTTGPNKIYSSLSTMTEQDYFAILSRLALAEPSLFTQMLGTFGPIQTVWGWLSKEWFTCLDGLDYLERQKLYLLGLSRLLELDSPMKELVLGDLQQFFEMWTGVVMELQDGVVDGTDTMIWGEIERREYDTPKLIVEMEVSAKDPVHTIHALSFVKERLQILINKSGGQEAFERDWAVNIDKQVLDKFWEMTRIGAGT